MRKFKGFGLMKLVRAVTDETGGKPFAYEVVVYDKLGSIEQRVMKIGDVNRYSKKLRMESGAQHALLIGFDVQLLTEEEFNGYLEQWVECA